tara:strand:- start:4024 stop:5352 length:1329 start_codon:yes stop_codon:yes gene_type:complete
MIHILIADDDKYFRMALKELLSDQAIFTEAESETEALAKLADHYFDMALIDMHIDGPNSGINILKETQKANIHSIILSSTDDKSLVEEAYLAGCNHFLTKLHYKTNLLPYVHKYKMQLFGDAPTRIFNKKYITRNDALKEKITEICKINLKNKAVLITGETGVGKSLVGKILHDQSYDHTKPFIHLNCAEISETLLESELFGHVKGAFTGAIADKEGKITQAHGGTLFLDEIATMPMVMQKKLLKALDEKSYYPVGSNKMIQSDFTLITATCEDLFDKIHKDQFRKDLFFRISGINLEIPALKDRPEDIAPLAEYFLNKSPRRVVLNQEALDKLQAYHWPGNIRELKKVIEYLCVKDKGLIAAEDIYFKQSSGEVLFDSWLTEDQKQYIAENGLREFIAKIEEESLKDTLSKHNGKITGVIKELKISSSAFYRIFNNLHLTN